MTGILASVFFLQVSSTIAAVKLRYITSVYTDDKGKPLMQPEGVACDNKSFLFVSDTGNGRLLRYVFQDKSSKQGLLRLKWIKYGIPSK